LNNLGFKVVKPEGAFYLWAVLPDYYKGEERFRTFAQSGNNPLLYLPGRLFGGIAYSNCVRFSGCVSHEVILLACEKLIEIDNRITKD
jgi:aspartate/methionine/tyrosine aminotransferase